MAFTVLSLVQEFCGKKTIPIPQAVVGSTDLGIIQIRYLLAEVVRELSEYQWEEQKIQKTWSSSNISDQGAFKSLFGADFREIVAGTMWDTTLKRPVFGPVSDDQWGNLQTFPGTGPIYQWKPFQQHLYIYPAPPSGHSMYVIYLSSYGILAGTTPQETITADSNTFLLPDILVTRCLDWKWKRQKGESWLSDYDEYMALLPKKITAKGATIHHLDGETLNITPGIWIPAGNWAGH